MKLTLPLMGKAQELSIKFLVYDRIFFKPNFNVTPN